MDFDFTKAKQEIKRLETDITTSEAALKTTKEELKSAQSKLEAACMSAVLAGIEAAGDGGCEYRVAPGENGEDIWIEFDLDKNIFDLDVDLQDSAGDSEYYPSDSGLGQLQEHLRPHIEKSLQEAGIPYHFGELTVWSPDLADID